MTYTPRLLLCDCQGSMDPDAPRLAQAAGLAAGPVATGLCMGQQDRVNAAMSQSGDVPVVIACAQEAARFAHMAEALGAPSPVCIDIRDRAGWHDGTASKANVTAKQAALLADELAPAPAVKTRDVTSLGRALVIGPAAIALPAAEALAASLSVTACLTDAPELVERPACEVVTGTLIQARGSLGQFALRFESLAMLHPGGRGPLTYTAPRAGAESQCDIIMDLRGETPLFPAYEKRDGYLRPDPGDPAAVTSAIAQAAQMLGVFEKPLYVALTPDLCAHSRAGQPGCSRCLDACPTGAITSAGDHVAVDPLICAGCGACSSLCPSGAISFDAPPVDFTMTRLRRLLDGFISAGGTAPRLLIHDDFGAEMIALAARHGAGLPGDVLPFHMPSLAAFGHAEALAGLAQGAVQISWLPGPRADLVTIRYEADLARAMGGEERIEVVEITDPEMLATALGASPAPATHRPIITMGARRQIARQAARALLPDAATVALPQGAPYGAVVVDTEACTLCLACASLCPSGALADNPDRPQLRFQEDACLQCGICATACPENAITLVPRMDPSEVALEQIVLNEEEPFCCAECAKPFGVASTVNRIMDQLAFKHPMFADSPAARLIQLCADCRVKAQFTQQNEMDGRSRNKVRTTEDYRLKN